MVDDEKLLANYRLIIENFENDYVKDIFNNYKTHKPDNGYLVNLEDYEALKNKIKVYSNTNASKIIENLTKLKTIEIKSSQYLINMLLNDNKYIIINDELWDLFGEEDKNDSHITYTIDKGLIIFSLDDNIQLKFTCWVHNNIINEFSFKEENNLDYYSKLTSGFKKIDTIYNQIYEYFKFENELMLNLNQEKVVKENKVNLGYLVDLKWLEKWKEKIKYDEIKKYFQLIKEEKKIKNKIIFFEEKNNLELQNLNVKHFESENKLKYYLKNNSLALVNFDFVHYFDACTSGKSVNYDIYKNIVKINLNFIELNIPINNNMIIISQNIQDKAIEESNLFQIHLKILINIFYSQKEIKLQINSDYSKYKNEKNEIYFISKNLMDKYKTFYDYNFLSKLLLSPELISVNYNNINNNYQQIYNFIETKNKTYLEQMNKKLTSEKFILSNENYDIDIKSYKQGNNDFLYLDNFEVVNEEIISDLEKIGIIKKENIIKGEYISGDKKILFCFKKNNKIYFQIDSFDNSANKFIIEYIIEGLTDLIFDYFKYKGINYFLDRIIDNKINYDTESICYCYKLNNIDNDIIMQEDIDNQISLDTDQDEEYIKNIIDILISFELFKFDIQNKVLESQSSEGIFITDVKIYNYYIVNKKIISEFFDLFWEPNISSIIQRYKLSKYSDINDSILKLILKDKGVEEYIKAIKDKNNIFKQKLKNIDLFEIDTSYIKENYVSIYYPKDFIFLDELLLSKFMNLFELNIDDTTKKKAEITINYNFGNIAFKKDEIFFLKNTCCTIFIYSIEHNQTKFINFNLDIILTFSDYSAFKKNYQEIISNNIKYYCLNLSSTFEIQYKAQIHLLKKNNEKGNEKKLDEILIILVELYKEYLSIQLNSSTNVSLLLDTIEDDYYVIDKNYMNDFASIIHFNEIKVILNKDRNIHLYFDTPQNECLNKLKNALSPDIKNKLMQINDNSNFDILNNYDKYKLKQTKFQEKNIYYFDNFIIINSKIRQILTKFNKYISTIIKSVDCFFENKKIYINFTDYITVWHLEQNEQLTIDYLILPKYHNHSQYIFSTIKTQGYLFIQKYLNSRYFCYTYDYGTLDYIQVQGEIYQINAQNLNQNSAQYFYVSEKLKKMILLYFELQNNLKYFNDISKNNNKLAEEVYLINPNSLLSNQCFIEIDSFMKANKNAFELLSTFSTQKTGINLNQIEEMLYNINTDEMKKLEQKCINAKFDKVEPMTQNIILNNRKQIYIFKSFIMLKQSCFNMINIEFGLKNLPKVLYTKSKKDDIIVDEKYSILSIGKIDEKDCFGIKYILLFNKEYDLINELKMIKASSVEQYIGTRTLFNNILKDDFISPIFSVKEIIGNCYKIDSRFNNYSNLTDYSKYLNNSNLQKAYILYDFYQKLKEKIQLNNYYEKEYYLINKEIMLNIKALYYYNDIKEIIDKINPIDNMNCNNLKILLYILKHLPENVFKKFIEEKSFIEKFEKNTMEPEIDPIYTSDMNKINESPLAYILKNFEIIDPITAQYFFHGIKLDNYYSKDNNLLKCIFKDGKILINYQQNFFGNTKDIIVIGSINSENTFINEYALIYDKNLFTHMQELKKHNINHYLNNVQFVNDSSPIIINEYIEIGKIIKLQSSNNNGQSMNFENQAQSNIGTYNNQYGGMHNNQNNIINNDYNYNNLNDEQYNLNRNNNFTSIKQYFTYSPLIGLDNIGATCYMNATLQCLCHIEKFVDYFKYNAHLINYVRNDIDKSKLSSSFKMLIEKLWPDNYNDNISTNTNYSYYSYLPSNSYENQNIYGNNKKNKSFPPEDFKKKISKMNPLFEGIQANDAKDLVQFLIMTLHEELNKAKNNNINNTISNDQTNKQFMFQIFAQDFIASNKSKISDLFYGVNYNIIQCGFCKTQSYNYQTYFFLVFPLEEVRIFKNQNNNFNYNYNYYFNNNNEVNIYDCFFYDQKINYMNGTNTMYCNYCKQTCNSSMRTILSTGPEILIIILNRGQGIQFNVKINFLEEINLENFIEMRNTGCNYKLIGVITHLGESGMGGHFISYCRDPISTTDWYKYNDSIVTKVENFKSEVIDFAMPYLLFYQKMN